ncbi:MAG: DUF3617 family protein [Nitrospiraceae bacterium]|nr:DUF3617 family protein [Nitrospiraceae bacterium]
MKKSLVAVLVLVFGLAGAASAELNMRDGNWESTIEMTIEGLPFAMPPMSFTNTKCMTKKDAVPSTASKDQKCEVKEQSVTGSTVHWKVVCKDKNGTSEGTGEITYSGTGYRGTMKLKTTDAKGQTTTSKAKLSGRRTGDCPK